MVSKFCESVLIQSKFEAVPPTEVGGVALSASSAEVDTLHQILGFCLNNFSPKVTMTLVLKVLECH